MKSISPLFLIVFLLFISYKLPAQTIQWARFDSSDVAYNKNDLTTLYPDQVLSYKKASNGDFIALHNVKGNVKFGNTTYNVPTGSAIIKVVYDKQMKFKSSIKLFSMNIFVFNFDIDENDNLYLFGTFRGVFYFTPNDSIKSMTPTKSNTFIVKYSSNNAFKWVRTINNDQDYIAPTELKVCKGNVYLLGYLNGGRFIYNSTQIYSWNYLYHVDYLISLDSVGSFRYVNRIRVSNQANFVTLTHFTIDSINEKAYFIGSCRAGGNIFTDRDTSNLTGGLSADNRILFKMDLKSGVFYKSKIIFTGGDGTYNFSIATNLNSIYIMSSFYGNINLLDTTLGSSISEFFLLKIDSNKIKVIFPDPKQSSDGLKSYTIIVYK